MDIGLRVRRMSSAPVAHLQVYRVCEVYIYVSHRRLERRLLNLK